MMLKHLSRDKRQLVKKINPNSLYGALLNPAFDERLGQSTTLTGRCIAKHMAGKLNEVPTGKYDTWAMLLYMVILIVLTLVPSLAKRQDPQW